MRLTGADPFDLPERRQMGVRWHLMTHPCDMDGVGMRKLHTWAKATLGPDCSEEEAAAKTPAHFQEGAQATKEIVWEFSVIFTSAFIFIDFNNKVFQSTHRSWCRQHCHCYKHWQILSSINPYALMYQNKTKKNHSSTEEGKSYSSSNSLEDSSYTEVGSIAVYSRKVFTAYILIISDAAEKQTADHLTAELKDRY